MNRKLILTAFVVFLIATLCIVFWPESDKYTNYNEKNDLEDTLGTDSEEAFHLYDLCDELKYMDSNSTYFYDYIREENAIYIYNNNNSLVYVVKHNEELSYVVLYDSDGNERVRFDIRETISNDVYNYIIE